MTTTWKSGKTGKTSTGVTLGLVGWRRIWNRQEKLIVRLHAFINHWTNSWPGLCSSRAQWPLAPNFCPWATRKSYFFIQIICWAPWISQFQSSGLPSIFLRAQPCWPVEYSCDQVFCSHGTILTVPKFKRQNSGQSFSGYNKRIWPVWCEHNDHLFEQQSRCPMWTEWTDWAVSCKESVKSIFKLVENLSGALWRKPQWHNKNYQVDWKFCVSLCAKPLLWGGSYSLLATFVNGISFFTRHTFG